MLQFILLRVIMFIMCSFQLVPSPVCAYNWHEIPAQGKVLFVSYMIKYEHQDPQFLIKSWKKEGFDQNT